jgi:DnaJ family protein C protein 11
MVDKHLSLDYTFKLLDGFKIKVGAAIGTIGGINGFVNTERQVTDNTRIGLGLTAALPGGLTMRIR